MRILIACEFSAEVRDAFRSAGHDAWSVDIEPTEGDPAWHHQGDALAFARTREWDMLLAFPPCTHLAVSGARWWPAKQADGRQARAARFVADLWALPIPRKAIENPVGWLNSHWAKPTQIVQPWQFGHGETKATCLWLAGLPPLTPTNVVDGRTARVWRMGQSKSRARERSRTLPGLAAAMASQWGGADL